MMQLSLFPRRTPGVAAQRVHGGEPARGRRKTQRPFVGRRPMHVVLHAARARGPLSMRKRACASVIHRTLLEQSARWSVRVYSYANSGNHLHLLIRCRDRAAFHGFLRSFTGLVARIVTGAARGRPAGRFWDQLAFSRILTPGRDFRAVQRYLVVNDFEASGLPIRRIERTLATRSRPP